MITIVKKITAKQSKKDFVKQVQERQAPTMPRIDPDEYPPIDGMEGPWRFKKGHILYYDNKEGRYYDRKTDLYVPDSYIL